MKTLIAFFTFLFVLDVSAQNLEIVTPQKTTNLTLQKMKSKLKSVKVKVDDPVYKKSVEYDAFLLNDVLQLGGVSPSSSADEIVFVSVDGYAPNTEFAMLKKYNAYLTFQVAGTAGFPDISQGKSMINPGPFYIVWKDVNKATDHVPWPYQLAKIEVLNWDKKFAKVYPQNAGENSAAKKGFLVFKAECIRCHSMNLQGGDLGPELNYPKNITEYWMPENVKEFIRDNTKFRAKSKMPPFKHLSEEQLNDLMAYLKFMAGQKL